jgi:ATP-binding cassette subfamily B protein
MLARSLAINPKILLLDDFTARVDINTEKQILKNLSQNYPDLTLISITQKIDPIKDYDQIFLFMEGELLASGKHDYLLQNSLEYEQIWESQQSAE